MLGIVRLKSVVLPSFPFATPSLTTTTKRDTAVKGLEEIVYLRAGECPAPAREPFNVEAA